MLGKFSEKAQKAIAIAESLAFDLGHASVGTEHLLLSFLKIKESKLRLMVEKQGLNFETLKDDIIQLFGKKESQPFYMEYTTSLKALMEKASYESRKFNEDKVSMDVLSYVLLDSDDNVSNELLAKYNVPVQKIKDEIKKGIKKMSELDLIDDLTNINHFVQKDKVPFVPRIKELQLLMESLMRRQKPNAILVGDPGVGKTALVYHLAQLINEGEVPNELKQKVIYEMDISSVVAGTKYRGEFEEKLKKILRKVKEDTSAILFIDEIHNIIGAGGAEGAIDASNILKPYLSRGEIQCIGATTYDEYVKLFEKEKALERRFQVIKVDEPTRSETQTMVEQLIPHYERFHQVQISNEVIPNLISLCATYIPTSFFPDKAIDVLDRAAVRTRQRRGTEVTEGDIIRVIEDQQKVAITKEKKATRLKQYLDERIEGQNEAIDKVVEQIRLIEEGLTEDNKPLGVLLFVGPTGVGKTETARLVAKSYFGDENRLIKVDMAEFMEGNSITKIIGSPPGYVGFDRQTQLVEQLRKNPHSVVLLDEIEKAHVDILDIFLNVFDEGYFIDASKRRIDFRNTILILTSNLGFGEELFHQRKVGYMQAKRTQEELMQTIKKHFRPEFLNRIDDIIFFEVLSPDTRLVLTKRYIEEYRQKVNVEFAFLDTEVDTIANDPQVSRYGARAIKREVKKVIGEKIKNQNKVIIP